MSGPSSVNYAENGEGAVATFTAEDPEGVTPITWSLATAAQISAEDDLADADNADAADHFMIDDKDGMLKFSSPPDYENPSGEGATSNTYKVVVVACDVALVSDACPASPDGQAGYQKVTVMVTKVNETGKVTWTVDPDGDGALTANDPTATPPEMPVMQFQVDAVLTATASDGDITNATQTFTADVTDEVSNVTWRWYRGGSVISGETANTYTVTTADVGSRIRVVATYRVGDSTTQENASLTSDYPVLAKRLGDNELEFDPDTVSREVDEGDKGMMVGAPVTAMGNHGAVNYALAGTDAAKFKIDRKTGQITTNVDLDYEADAATDNCDGNDDECEVTVTATDATGQPATNSAAVTIDITDVDEKPTFSAGAKMVDVYEGSTEVRADSDTDMDNDADDTANPYTAGDPEGLNVNLTLMGPDASHFSLSSGGDLSFNGKPDYEMPADADMDNVYEVTVRASDGTLTEDRMVMVTVTGKDEAPVIMAGDAPSGDGYDTNGTPGIQQDELIDAIEDYLDREISIEELIDVIELYLG